MSSALLPVLVTGSTRGLGFELARMLLRAGGYHVLAVGRSWQGAASAGEGAGVAGGGGGGGGIGSSAAKRALTQVADTRDQPSKTSAVSFHTCADVGDVSARLELVDSVVRTLGTQKLACLVNNAGVFPRGWDEDAFARALRTNAWGPLCLADELRPAFMDGAHVVNVTSGMGSLRHVSPHYRRALEAAGTLDELCSSISFAVGGEEGEAQSGVKGAVGAPAYCLSKAALNRGTQILAAQWEGVCSGGLGVRVSSVDPGWCATDMGLSGGRKAPRTALEGATTLFGAVVGSPAVVGTGRCYGHDLKRVPW